MKQKLKRNKGITLIALILTIIVLLILAVVAINAVKGDGIIGHAKNAKSDYTKAQANEQTTLQGYLNEIDKSQVNVQVTIDGKKVNLTEDNVKFYLGKEVENFVSQAGQETTWDGAGTFQGKMPTKFRLYYVDFNNKYGDGAGTIYLKADYSGDSTNGLGISGGSLVRSDYELWIHGNEDGGPLATEEDFKFKNLNPSLYANGVTPPDIKSTSMEVVAGLTNTKIWNQLLIPYYGESTINEEYKDNVNYVIGAPSLEMMIDSYNAYYGLTGDTLATEEELNNSDRRYKLFYRYTSNTVGYKVGPTYNGEFGSSSYDMEKFYPWADDFSRRLNGDKYFACGNLGCGYLLASPLYSGIGEYGEELESVAYVYWGDGIQIQGTGIESSRGEYMPIISLKPSTQLKLTN